MVCNSSKRKLNFSLSEAGGAASAGWAIWGPSRSRLAKCATSPLLDSGMGVVFVGF